MSFCGSCSQDLTPNPPSPTGNLPPNGRLGLGNNVLSVPSTLISKKWGSSKFFFPVFWT